MAYGVVLCVFFFSGAASLIYQVAWQRLLTLYYGVGPVSVAIVVSVFLAGLGIGALLGGWLSERVRRPLYVYLLAELFIGVFATVSAPIFTHFLAQLASMPLVVGLSSVGLALLCPTTLMGMTLPLMLKALNVYGRDPGHSLSLLYLANTLGAAFGALLAAYGLISFFGISGAIYAAAAMNFVIALVVRLALRIPQIGDASSAAPSGDPGLTGIGFQRRGLAYPAVFVTGFLAIGYQIVWFRICSTLLKPSPYVFATALAIYLVGIAAGSYWLSRRIKRLHANRSHLNAFCKLNAGIAILTLITYALVNNAAGLDPLKWMLRTSFAEELHPPYHPIYAFAGATWPEYLKSIYLVFDILLWPTLIMLPSTLLMGASFPLVAAMAIQADAKEGLLSGKVYALTILGNVAGGLVTGLVLLPQLGSERVLIGFTVAGAFWILGVDRVRGFRLAAHHRWAATIAVCVLAPALMPKAKQLYQIMHPQRPDEIQTITEDVDGVVAIYRSQQHGENRAIVYIGGSNHATFPSAAYRAEALEAITYAPSVKDTLVIGFGGGDLTDTLLHTPEVTTVTVVEISDALVDNIKRVPFYKSILRDSRLQLVVDDGRRHLLRNSARYDLITMDPLRSTAAYSNNLYSREFFDLIKAHLNDGGVLMLWMNEYELIPNTLASVFAHLRCYYFFCLASDTAMTAHPARREALWATFTPEMQHAVLSRIRAPYYYTGDRAKIVEMSRGKPVNTDLDPITEYYWGYNLKRYWGRF